MKNKRVIEVSREEIIFSEGGERVVISLRDVANFIVSNGSSPLHSTGMFPPVLRFFDKNCWIIEQAPQCHRQGDVAVFTPWTTYALTLGRDGSLLDLRIGARSSMLDGLADELGFYEYPAVLPTGSVQAGLLELINAKIPPAQGSVGSRLGLYLDCYWEYGPGWANHVPEAGVDELLNREYRSLGTLASWVSSAEGFTTEKVHLTFGTGPLMDQLSALLLQFHEEKE